MIEPLPYRQLNDPVCCVNGNVTLDGWAEAKWSGRRDIKLEPNEVHEFCKLAIEFIKLLPEFTTLQKYMKKHGRSIRSEGIDPTLAFTVDRPLLIYNVEVTGPNVLIEAYRKEE